MTMFNLFAGISAGASAAILLLLLLSPLFKKRYPAKWRYALWIAVCLFALFPIRLLIPRSAPALSLSLPVRGFTLGTNTPIAQKSTGTVQTVETSESTTSLPDTTSAKPPITVSITILLTAVWLLGLFIFLLFEAAKYAAFTQALKRQRASEAAPDTLAVFERVKRELRIRKKVGLCIYSELPSPMLIGFRHPRVLLSQNAESLDGLEFIVRHELIHFKRIDLYVKLLSLFVNAVHWFNPLVYVMRRQMDIECELSCDEAVLNGTEKSIRCRYGNTVLSVMGTSIGQRTALSTYFHSGKETLKMRLSTMLDMKKKKFGTIALSISLVFLFGVCAFATVGVHPADTTAENILNSIEFNYPPNITRIANDNVSEIKFYSGKVLVGTAKFVPYNKNDPDGDGISVSDKATVTGTKQYSTIQNIPSVNLKLTIIDNAAKKKLHLETHVFLVPNDNTTVLDIYEIDGTGNAGMANYIAKNFTTVKQLPLEGAGWTKVDFDKASVADKQSQADNKTEIEQYNNPSIDFIKSLYPKTYGTDIKEVQALNYIRYSAKRIFGNTGGCNVIFNFSNIFIDKNDVVTEVRMIQPLELGIDGVFAVSAYRTLRPLDLPQIDKISAADAERTAVICKGNFMYSNIDKLDAFIVAVQNKKPGQIDVIDGQVVCRYVYDGKNLSQFTAFETMAGYYKIYEKTELQKITKQTLSSLGDYYTVTSKDNQQHLIAPPYMKFWPGPLSEAYSFIA